MKNTLAAIVLGMSSLGALQSQAQEVKQIDEHVFAQKIGSTYTFIDTKELEKYVSHHATTLKDLRYEDIIVHKIPPQNLPFDKDTIPGTARYDSKMHLTQLQKEQLLVAKEKFGEIKLGHYPSGVHKIYVKNENSDTYNVLNIDELINGLPAKQRAHLEIELRQGNTAAFLPYMQLDTLKNGALKQYGTYETTIDTGAGSKVIRAYFTKESGKGGFKTSEEISEARIFYNRILK